jgi:hypothetical protein
VTEIRHANLTRTARTCREKAREAFVSRFASRFASRYRSDGKGNVSYLLDVTALAHPSYHGMKWVEAMSDDADHAGEGEHPGPPAVLPVGHPPARLDWRRAAALEHGVGARGVRERSIGGSSGQPRTH